MTDKEIKQALNECLSFEMFESRTGLTIDDIADLINRLTEQLNSAINGQETLQEYIAKQDKEIERLRNGIKKSVEWKKLFEANMQATREFQINEAKAEAYKEFAEKVNKMPYYPNFAKFHEAIDNLLKEMVGEGNG